jgi:hypothetical protein
MFFPRILFLLGCAALAGCQTDAARVERSAAPEPPTGNAPLPVQFPDTLELATKPPGQEAYDAYLKPDTLLVVSPDQAVFYPFGRVTKATALTARYPLFAVQQGVARYRGDPYPYTLLRFGNSAVKFYDNAEDGATVVSGHLVDPEIILANGVRLGYTLPQLLSTYSVTVPADKARNLRTVTVASALAGIIYHYSFENKRLVRIDLDSYSIIDKSL